MTFYVNLDPPLPCVGQTLVLDGHDQPDATETIWLGPPDSTSGSTGLKPDLAPDLVKLGTITADGEGRWRFSFLLKPVMEPTASGGSITLQGGSNYTFVIQNNRGGTMWQVRMVQASCGSSPTP